MSSSEETVEARPAQRLEETLKERGLSALAIQRVIAAKSRMKLKDNDPLFDLFFELEWYLKQMESIPHQIEQSQAACKAAVEAETEKLVQRSVNEFAREISHQISRSMALRAKTDYLSMLSRACAQILVVTAIALTVGFSLSGRWPAYFDTLATDNALLNFIYSSLQAPTYMTVLVLLLTAPTLILAEKLIVRGKGS